MFDPSKEARRSSTSDGSLRCLLCGLVRGGEAIREHPYCTVMESGLMALRSNSSMSWGSLTTLEDEVGNWTHKDAVVGIIVCAVDGVTYTIAPRETCRIDAFHVQSALDTLRRKTK